MQENNWAVMVQNKKIEIKQFREFVQQQVEPGLTQAIVLCHLYECEFQTNSLETQ